MEMLQTALPFWNKLTQVQQDALQSSTASVQYAKGEQIHNGTQDCLGLLLLKTGRLCVSLLSSEGRQVALFCLLPGDVCVMSASCIIRQIDFDVMITAEENTEVLQISAAAFSGVAKENVYAENFLLRLATERFSDVMWAVQQMLFASFDVRLASYLLEAAVNGEVHATHQQIAQHIGSAREVVSRTLKRFADKGYVQVQRSCIEIKNAAALRALK